jgi:hypothetical protein
MRCLENAHELADNDRKCHYAEGCGVFLLLDARGPLKKYQVLA